MKFQEFRFQPEVSSNFAINIYYSVSTVYIL